MSCVKIDGIDYEKNLLEIAACHTIGLGKTELSKDHVLTLIASAKEAARVAEIQVRTLEYIRENFDFSEVAAELFDEEVSRL